MIIPFLLRLILKKETREMIKKCLSHEIFAASHNPLLVSNEYTIKKNKTYIKKLTKIERYF